LQEIQPLPAATVADAAWRLAYRLGYRMARAWWRLRGPDHHGAVVAVWFDGRILAVEQSYKSGMTLPGGGIHHGEDAHQAALRELREELGLAVEPDALSLACRMTVPWEYRQDHVRIFELVLTAPPDLVIDNREIVRAVFMEPDTLLALPTPPFVPAYLRRRAAVQ
jgi:8-oxo-dGTP diphosphatase